MNLGLIEWSQATLTNTLKEFLNIDSISSTGFYEYCCDWLCKLLGVFCGHFPAKMQHNQVSVGQNNLKKYQNMLFLTVTTNKKKLTGKNQSRYKKIFK